MSGSITITPGKQFAPGELVTRAGLNQLGRPVGQVDTGAITDRELAQSVNNVLAVAGGRNLLCNGDFNLKDYFLAGSDPLTGVISGGGHNHDFGAANRWLTANDANRTATIGGFSLGQTDVPDSPTSFLHWAQSAALSINPGYMGQRLENVRALAGRKITLSIWVRASAQLSVTPKLRQFFGSGGSADVVTAGTPTQLATDTWKQIVATFDVPSVAGKTITSISFTEIRIEVPQAITFQIDFAHAQLELGGAASRFEPKGIYEDAMFAARYYEVLEMVLSNAITVWKPFLMSRVPLARSPSLTLVPASGTGGTIGGAGVPSDCIVQTANHSAIVLAQVVVDAELYG